MSYVISIDKNTYNMVDYLHGASTDYTLFNEGISLQGLNLNLIYQVKNKSSFNKLKKLHMISTTGPELVSRELRSVLECIAPTDVEFFDAKVIYEDEQLDGFSAINPIIKENCCNMDISDKVKMAIFNAGLKGVKFCKSLDMTYKNRTSCEVV